MQKSKGSQQQLMQAAPASQLAGTELFSAISLHSPDVWPHELATQPGSATIRVERSTAKERAAIAADTTAAAAANSSDHDTPDPVPTVGEGGAVLSRPAVAQMIHTPLSILRRAVAPPTTTTAEASAVADNGWSPAAPPPASPEALMPEEQRVSQQSSVVAEEEVPMHVSPIAGVATSSPSRGLMEDAASMTEKVAAVPRPTSTSCRQQASQLTSGQGHSHGIRDGLRKLVSAASKLASCIVGAVWVAVRTRPLTTAAVAAVAVLVAAALAVGVLLELVLLPLISVPAFLVSWAISFGLTATAMARYHHNRAAAQRRHVTLGMFHGMFTSQGDLTFPKISMHVFLPAHGMQIASGRLRHRIVLQLVMC